MWLVVSHYANGLLAVLFSYFSIMRTLILLFTFLVAGRSATAHLQDSAETSVDTEIQQCVALLRAKGLDAAITLVKESKTPTGEMLMKALRAAKEQNPASRADAIFLLQSTTRQEEFRDLQRVLKNNAEPLTFSPLTSWMAPPGGILQTRIKVNEEYNEPVWYLNYLPETGRFVADGNDLVLRDPSLFRAIQTLPFGSKVTAAYASKKSITIVRRSVDSSQPSNERATISLLEQGTDGQWQEYSLASQLPANCRIAITPDGQTIVVPMRKEFLSIQQIPGSKAQQSAVIGEITRKPSATAEDQAALAIEFLNDTQFQVVYDNGVMATFAYPEFTLIEKSAPLGENFTSAVFSSDHSKIVLISDTEVLVVAGKDVTRLAGSSKSNSGATTAKTAETRQDTGASVLPRMHTFTCVAAVGNSTIAVGDSQGNLHLWTGAPYRHRRFRLHSRKLNCISRAQDPSKLVTGGSDGYICVVDPENPASGQLPDDELPRIISQDFSSGWRALETGSTVTIVDTVSRQPVHQVPVHSDRTMDSNEIQSVGVSSDRQTVTYSQSGRITHWDKQTGKLKTLPVSLTQKDSNGRETSFQPQRIQLSPEGDVCVCWNLKEGSRVHVVDAKTGNERFVLSASSNELYLLHSWINKAEFACIYAPVFENAEYDKSICSRTFLEWKNTPSRYPRFDQQIICGICLNNVATNSQRFLIRGVEGFRTLGLAIGPDIAVSSGLLCPDRKQTAAVVFLLNYGETRSFALPEPECEVFGITGDGRHFLTFTAKTGGILRIWSCDHGGIVNEVNLRLPYLWDGSQPHFDGRVVQIESNEILLNE